MVSDVLGNETVFDDDAAPLQLEWLLVSHGLLAVVRASRESHDGQLVYVPRKGLVSR